MKDRRNYYRILRVQPDASTEVIQHAYRSLMQKLRHHPDLGGDPAQASTINLAYASLRDPKKRERYDRELLRRYHIKTLSRGNLPTPPPATPCRSSAAKRANQRNYFRVLHVQVDAEPAVIEASYNALRKKPGVAKALLDEAWAVLGHSQKRQRYKRLLRGVTHHEALAGLADADTVTATASNTTLHARQAAAGSTGIRPMAPANKAVSGYRPSITQYCLFCKTPYAHSAHRQWHRLCDECHSPLPASTMAAFKQPSRGAARLGLQTAALVYDAWPATALAVTVADWSPTGLSFVGTRPLESGQVIKIDAATFKAVATLSYCRATGKVFKMGARFVAVEFGTDRGNFLSTSA